MLNPQSLELRVGVDVGSRSHHVAVGLSDGRLLDEFEIPHTAAGFREFFARIEGHAKRHPYPIAVAMEGYNGHVRPLDSLVRVRGWQLFNVNNLKLARFKEIFPAPAKSDRIDSEKSSPCSLRISIEIATWSPAKPKLMIVCAMEIGRAHV